MIVFKSTMVIKREVLRSGFSHVRLVLHHIFDITAKIVPRQSANCMTQEPCIQGHNGIDLDHTSVV